MTRTWKIIFLILAAFFVFLVFSNLVDKWAFPDTRWDLSGEGEKIEINPGYQLKQKFKAERDNLSRIRILFGRSYNKDGGKINLKLADESCKNIIREESFKRSSIQSEGYYDFKFSKVADSKGENFCLTVEFNPQKDKYKDLNIFLSNNPVPGSQLIIDNQKEEIKNGALAMRPAYQADNLTENIKELNQRISQYKPWFLKNIYLFMISFLFIFLTFFFLVLIIFV